MEEEYGQVKEEMLHIQRQAPQTTLRETQIRKYADIPREANVRKTLNVNEGKNIFSLLLPPSEHFLILISLCVPHKARRCAFTLSA